ncbi:MAG: hypothetical protein ACK4IX_12280 [Candidatus Sericytochromatia bacterium]
MSNMSIKLGTPTPLEKVANSTPVKFVTDSPITATTGIVGAGTAAVLIADKTKIGAANALKKGIIPAVGLGIATAGVLVADHAIRKGEDPIIKTLGAGAGATAAIAGVEIAGRGLGVKVLQPATAIGKAIAKAPLSVSMPTMFVGFGAVVSAEAIHLMKKDGAGAANTGMLTFGASTAMLAGTFLTEAVKKPGISKVLEKGTLISGGTGLMATSYFLAKNSKEAFSKGENDKALLSTVGAVATGLGGTAFAIAGVSEKLADKVVAKAVQNPALTAAVVATAFSAGAYYVYSQKAQYNESQQSKK